MPHPYFNDIVKAFNEMTVEALQKTANYKFMQLFGEKLGQKFMVVTPTAMNFCLGMEINLDDRLTGEELETLVTASINALDNLYLAMSQAFVGLSRMEFINNFPPKTFSVKLN